MKENMTNTNSNKKEYKSWEKSERSGNAYKSMRVEEIENGFVITIDSSSHGKEYKYECKKWYSETNPLEKEQPINKEKNSLLDAIEQFNKDF